MSSHYNHKANVLTETLLEFADKKMTIRRWIYCNRYNV